MGRSTRARRFHHYRPAILGEYVPPPGGGGVPGVPGEFFGMRFYASTYFGNRYFR